MPTTRRTNATSPSSMPSSSAKPAASQLRIPAPTHTPYLPTRTELLLLALYPTTLFLGSLFANLSPLLQPPANSAVYSEAHQSYQPASAAPSYFARKSNVFNVYFVKIGWLWCTTALVMFTLFVANGRVAGVLSDGSSTASGTGGSGDEAARGAARMRRRAQTALRYALATLLWIITTQWFFGPALVDRGFALTGGVCDVATERLAELRRVQAQSGPGEDLIVKEKEELAKAVSHAACRVAGGAWKGGWDISGHVFILVLGSGMLWMEMLPFLLPRVKGLGLARVVRTPDARDSRIGNEMARLGLVSAANAAGDEVDSNANDKIPTAWTLRAYATTLALGVAVLSWWMLLMTAAFFHTWFEKLTGLLWALFGLWVIYFLPRGQPGFRSVVGMPGF